MEFEIKKVSPPNLSIDLRSTSTRLPLSESHASKIKINCHATVEKVVDQPVLSTRKRKKDVSILGFNKSTVNLKSVALSSAEIQSSVESNKNDFKQNRRIKNDLDLTEQWLNMILSEHQSKLKNNKVEDITEVEEGNDSLLSLSGMLRNTALGKAGLNRFDLNEFGLTAEEIDRVYRSLFVYSKGFHDVLCDIMHCHKKKGREVASKILCLYSHIIEGMDPHLYQSSILLITEEKTKAFNEMKHKCDDIIENLQSKCSMLEANVTKSEDKNLKLDLIVEIERQRNGDLQRLYNESVKLYNEEKSSKDKALVRVSDLERQSFKYNSEIEKLKKELENVINRNQGLSNINESLMMKVNNLNESLHSSKEQDSRLQNVIRDLSQNKAANEVYIRDLEWKIKNAEEAVSRHLAEKLKMTETMGDLMKKNSKNELEISIMLEREKQSEEANRNRNEENNKIRSDLFETSLLLTQKTSKVEELLSHIKRIQADYEDALKSSNDLNLLYSREIDELKGDIKLFKIMEEEFAREKNRAEEYKKLSKSKAVEVLNFKKSVSDLSDDLQLHKRGLSMKESEIKVLMTQISRQKSELRQAEEDIATLRVDLEKANAGIQNVVQEKCDEIITLKRLYTEERTLVEETRDERDQANRMYEKVKGEMMKLNQLIVDYDKRFESEKNELVQCQSMHQDTKDQLVMEKDKVESYEILVINFIESLFNDINGSTEDVKSGSVVIGKTEFKDYKTLLFPDSGIIHLPLKDCVVETTNKYQSATVEAAKRVEIISMMLNLACKISEILNMKFLSFNEQIAEYEKMIETLQINFKQMEAEKNETILSKEEEIKVVSAKILVLESNITQKEEEADGIKSTYNKIIASKTIELNDALQEIKKLTSPSEFQHTDFKERSSLPYIALNNATVQDDAISALKPIPPSIVKEEHSSSPRKLSR